MRNSLFGSNFEFPKPAVGRRRVRIEAGSRSAKRFIDLRTWDIDICQDCQSDGKLEEGTKLPASLRRWAVIPSACLGHGGNCDCPSFLFRSGAGARPCHNRNPMKRCLCRSAKHGDYKPLLTNVVWRIVTQGFSRIAGRLFQSADPRTGN
jgi:hypothetical protein